VKQRSVFALASEHQQDINQTAVKQIGPTQPTSKKSTAGVLNAVTVNKTMIKLQLMTVKITPRLKHVYRQQCRKLSGLKRSVTWMT